MGDELSLIELSAQEYLAEHVDLAPMIYSLSISFVPFTVLPSLSWPLNR